MTVRKPTKEELAWIKSLKRLASKMPKTLWLYAASGTAIVMMKNEHGEQAFIKGDGVDQAYAVEIVRELECDGGDF